MQHTMERDLARQFYLAYVAYQQGVTFRTAEKNYGDNCENIGELWLTLARFTIDAMRHSHLGTVPLPAETGIVQ